jgi:hypothetical protein
MLQIGVHQIGRVEHSAAQAHSREIDARQNHPAQVGAIENDGDAGVFATPLIPRLRTVLEMKENIVRQHGFVIRSTRAIALIDDGRYQRSGHVAATLARGGN